MNKIFELCPEFVHYMPKDKAEGILYISEEFEQAIHVCPCGCGKTAHTTFGSWQDSWTLTNNNGLITMSPSILNRWCGAHYYIRENKIVWC